MPADPVLHILIIPIPGEVAVCDKHGERADLCCGDYTTTVKRVADPLGLLRDGLCGSKPPTAGLFEGVWYTEGDLMPDPADVFLPRSPEAQALVLKWRGQVVPEGMDRAHRCFDSTWVTPGNSGGAYRRALPGDIAARFAEDSRGVVVTIDRVKS